MAWPQLFMGGALLGTAILAAATTSDPRADFAPPALRLASASFEGPVHAQVTHVVDGDTFEARATIWLGQSIEVRVRIAGVDAPELHARCDEELARAQAARDWLIKRIEGAEVRPFFGALRQIWRAGGRGCARFPRRCGGRSHCGRARPPLFRRPSRRLVPIRLTGLF